MDGIYVPDVDVFVFFGEYVADHRTPPEIPVSLHFVSSTSRRARNHPEVCAPDGIFCPEPASVSGIQGGKHGAARLAVGVVFDPGGDSLCAFRRVPSIIRPDARVVYLRCGDRHGGRDSCPGSAGTGAAVETKETMNNSKWRMKREKIIGYLFPQFTISNLQFSIEKAGGRRSAFPPKVVC